VRPKGLDKKSEPHGIIANFSGYLIDFNIFILLVCFLLRCLSEELSGLQKAIAQKALAHILSSHQEKAGIKMSETLTLDDHQAIREWAAARAGNPAFISTSDDSAPVLRIVFEPEYFADVERPLDAGGLEVVGWDDWFRVFDEEKLVMLVSKERPGKLDNYHQILKA
jgi:hypothetical protein